MTDGLLRALARLAVAVGANVQRGQIVSITAELAHAPLVRAVAEEAYRRGARFVDVRYFDTEVKRLRLLHAAEETLEFVPSWLGEAVLAMGRERAATVALTPVVQPGLLLDVEPARAGKDQLPFVKERMTVLAERTVNSSILPGPTAHWARAVFPELPADDALEQLWSCVADACRLDEEDPVAAWSGRAAQLRSLAERLTERRFDALHFTGPGTDLTVGLLPGSRWIGGGAETVDGIRFMPNLPTEEVFTAPDPLRVDGVVRATRPLSLGGVTVEGLSVRFEQGRAVEIDADEGADAIRAACSLDEGASRLGEVALVDRDSRVGLTGTVFRETLLDENTASHLAFGTAYAVSVDGADGERANQSQTHIDFMIGGSDIDVTAVTRDGERLPLLPAGTWAI